MLIVIIFSFLLVSTLVAQIFSRNQKKLHITSQAKFYNKILGLVIIVTTFMIFVPLVSYLAKIFYCDTLVESSCFKDSHLALTCFSTLAIFLLVVLSMYTLSMMTSCYPNETVPWAHFPSRLMHVKVMVKVFVVLAY